MKPKKQDVLFSEPQIFTNNLGLYALQIVYKGMPTCPA